MSNLLALTYIFSIVGLLFIGLLLLCIKVAPQLTNVKYRRAKVLLGVAPLLPSHRWLSISRLIATCLGGKIYVDTTYTKGCRIKIELPMQMKA